MYILHVGTFDPFECVIMLPIVYERSLAYIWLMYACVASYMDLHGV